MTEGSGHVTSYAMVQEDDYCHLVVVNRKTHVALSTSCNLEKVVLCPIVQTNIVIFFVKV